ncbi:MFS transporter [Phaeacidiphilus oryzae]|uniref:MFS transporter n=1 Tax=Phaeacidiphilus oryzae TaxID=348818 RepID=UPI002244F77B|nr:MFS transporter [Phaeacidiphilus oryzae]
MRRRPDAWRLAVLTVCFGAFMGQLDASIVTLTYPALGAEFHAPLAAVQWVSLSYLLTLVALLVPVGRFSDARGRKLMYLYGFALFTAASAACGLAPGLVALIAFRVLQAVGAALLQANSVALVTTSAPRERMRGALGMQAAGQAIGLALGPTVGGVLVATVGWRWVFGINVPVGIVAMVAGHYLLPRTRHRAEGARTDPAGVLLLGGATTAGLLALSAASGLRLPDWSIGALAAVAVAAGALFVRRQLRLRRPMVDLRLLAAERIGSGLLGALCGYLVLFGPLVLVPVEFDRLHLPVLVSGAVLTALPFGFALAATLGDRALPTRWDDRRRAWAGALGCAAALALMAALPATPTVLPVLLALLGIALGVFTPANNTLVMSAVPAASAGTGGGLVNMARGLGTALGVAAVTLALHLAGQGSAADRVAVLVLLAVSLVAVLTALPQGRRRNG